ncbi:hypothetical protein KBB96_10385 [Luteolibacter ambystomatis]|uniref:Fibronectin type-III domain-containing protein n=1 Tax=Luteolibacter ambystomatis TaxID=2824561 RepID=A0A975G4P6_9BACT|nr:choice-of-anchor tandem repeat GloVer-containing protein [Luteolibacter ambystomatis]QUE49279.1 hypothetical protein KBB96_10385 [Luteolibacter ambystomatis]
MSRSVIFRSGLLLLATSFALHAAPVFEPLQGFVGPPDGVGDLTCGSDGNFYGVSRFGGAFYQGALIRMTPAGQATLVSHFEGEIGAPAGPLTPAPDGRFYGMTVDGSVFHMTLEGTLTKIASLPSTVVWTSNAMVLATDGNLYGVTHYPGDGHNYGSIFRVTPSGMVQILQVFSEITGYASNAALVQGVDGLLHGTTSRGGSGGCGTIFTLSLDGVFQVTHHLSSDEGSDSTTELVPTPDGSLYGALASDPQAHGGKLFRITPAGDFITVHVFDGTTSVYPGKSMVRTADGSLFGTTAYGGAFGSGMVFRLSAGGKFTILHSFDPDRDIGTEPFSGLVQGLDGNFYGTTSNGLGYGGAFRVTSAGKFSFIGAFGSSGMARPVGPLVQDRNGNFYGCATAGGTRGGGTFFRINGDHEISSLYDFDGLISGSSPLVVGRDGNFYGANTFGATRGSFFRLTPEGRFSLLTEFGNLSPTIAGPRAPVLGSDGNFYSCADINRSGSFNPCIIRLTPRGRVDVLADFDPGQGDYPRGALVQGADGGFRGVSSFYNFPSSGVVFSFSPGGGVTTLAPSDELYDGNYDVGLTAAPGGEFYGVGPHGIKKLTADNQVKTVAVVPNANSKLLLAADGNFYGTTSGGHGSVFRMTPAGQVTTIHTFSFLDGSEPAGGLMQAADGHLYGTTQFGGTTSDGRLAGGGEFFRIRLGATFVTEAASAVTWIQAVLSSSVDPGGLATAVYFQYGTDPTLKSSSAVRVGTVPVGAIAMVSTPVTGLLPNRTYYYRVVTQNAENPVPQAGAIRSFTTARLPTLRELLGLGGPR